MTFVSLENTTTKKAYERVVAIMNGLSRQGYRHQPGASDLKKGASHFDLAMSVGLDGRWLEENGRGPESLLASCP